MLALSLLTAGCIGGSGSQRAAGDPPAAAQLATACSGLTNPDIISALPVAGAQITSAEFVAATDATPVHCRVDGEINRRIGIDGQSYAIRYRLRMPIATWNGRFFMGGGSGTNGVLVDPTAQLSLGYATIGTDGGHSTTANNIATAGGTASFGVDPQARSDFAYNAYDYVTQVGKALVQKFYQRAPEHAYYMGCSEGGREGMLMSQRFPDYYDGIISGDPVLRIALGPMAGIYTTQLFYGLAKRSGLAHADGIPAINKSYSDTDLQLLRTAILDACDAQDGLADGIVDNFPACTTAVVNPRLMALQCKEAKNDSCLSTDQIDTLKLAFAGPVNSAGIPLYVDWQWDAGIGGFDGTRYNTAWRSWWLGTYDATRNNANKLTYATAQAVIYTTPPVLPISAADALNYSLNYNFDTDPITIYNSSPTYPRSAASMLHTDALDLSRFRDRGGKIMIYHGSSDSSVSVKDTLNWYTAMNANMNNEAAEFARMYVVPGMGHCSGGPATDQFDMLPKLVDWVENGVAPEAVIATAANPRFFGVAARSRPLCPYPKQARYQGSGDINVAANFSCQ